LLSTQIGIKTMKNTIQTIIEKEIPKGCIFDAHSIIEYLIQNHSDIYLSTYKNGWTTEYYHSEISKLIVEFENVIITRIGESWSINLHKKFSKNTCWAKL